MLIGQKNKFFFAGILIAALFVQAGSAHAAFDYRYDNKEDLKGQYEAGVADKLTRGISNILFGWTEIGRTPAKMSAGIEHGPIFSFLIGLPYGVLRAAGRTLVGAYETVTFFAPQSPIMENLKGDIE